MKKSNKVKKFALIDALFFSVSLSTNIVSYSLIATIPNLQKYGVVITTLLVSVFYLLIELPSSIFADRYSWAKSVFYGQILKLLSQGSFFLSILFAIQDKIAIMWTFLVLTTLLDSIGSSLISGSYESAFITWFNNKKENLFVKSFRYHLWARVLPSFLIIILTAVLIFTYQSNYPYVVLFPVVLIIIGRAFLIIKINDEISGVKNDKGDHIVQAFRGILSNFLRTTHQVFTYSVFKYFRLLATGILISYLYKLLSFSEFPYGATWFFGAITSLFIYYASLYLAKKTFHLFDYDKFNFNSVVLVLYAFYLILAFLLIYLNYIAANFYVFIIQSILSLFVLVSSSFVISQIKGNLKSFIKNNYIASWISVSESISILFFIIGSLLVYYYNASYVVNIYLSVGILLAVFGILSLKGNLKDIKLFTFKKLMAMGFLLLFTVAVLITTLMSLKLTYNSLLQSQDKNVKLLVSKIASELKEDMLIGSFVNLKFKASEFSKMVGITCVQVDYGAEKIFNNCSAKADSMFFKVEDIEVSNSYIGRLTVFYNLNAIDKIILNLGFKYLVLFLIVFIVGAVALKLIIALLYREIENVLHFHNTTDTDLSLNYTFEFSELKSAISELINTRMAYNAHSAQIKIATQVAHDIKSPLAALEIVMDDIRELPEDSRELTLNAINRIQEIANNLSKEAQKDDEAKDVINLISYPIRATINEKRLELQSKSHLQIEFLDRTNQMNFTKLSSIEVSRIISNLVNNAAEAIHYKGEISVQLEKNVHLIELTIKDNGAGFPESMLKAPIVRGNTIGKEKGQGLGLFYAYETTINAGGEFAIYNQNGAVIKITIPVEGVPEWFCSDINFSGYAKIIVIDDDKSIHDLWNRVFKEKSISNEVVHLQNRYEIENGIKHIGDTDLVLIDLDLRYQKNGIEIISEKKFKNVILVSSGHEQKSVQEFCISQRIKLLPKYLIGKI